MQFIDLMRISLRPNVNFNEITDNEILNIINDPIFNTLNIKGAAIIFLIYHMQKLQFTLSIDIIENMESFKNLCKIFITRVCNLSSINYTQEDIELFSNYFYFNTLYSEGTNTKLSKDFILNDINILESFVENYIENNNYIDYDGLWLALENLKIILVQLYNNFFPDLLDKNKPLQIINTITPTNLEHRQILQNKIIDNIQFES